MRPPEFDVGLVEGADELAAAHAVWLASNAARGRTPSPERRARVHQKLADSGATVVVARQHGAVVGMARAEALRVDDGVGPLVPGWGHIDMVFVDPDRWGEGIGGQLLDWLHQHMAAQGWLRTSLWTRVGNERAIGLYLGHGYVLNGRESQLPDGSAIVQLERVGR